MHAYFCVTLLLCCCYGYALDTFSLKNTGVATNITGRVGAERNEKTFGSSPKLEKEIKDWRRKNVERAPSVVRSGATVPQMSLERRNAYNSIRDRRAYFKRSDEVSRQRRPSSRKVDPEKDILEPQETVHRPQQIIPKQSVINNMDKKYYEFGVKIPRRVSTKLSLIDDWGTTALPRDMENLVMPPNLRYAPKAAQIINQASNQPSTIRSATTENFRPMPMPLSAVEGKLPTRIEDNKNNQRVLSKMSKDFQASTMSQAAPTNSPIVSQASNLSNQLSSLKPHQLSPTLIPAPVVPDQPFDSSSPLSKGRHSQPISTTSQSMLLANTPTMGTSQDMTSSSTAGEVMATTEVVFSNNGSTLTKELFPSLNAAPDVLMKMNKSLLEGSGSSTSTHIFTPVATSARATPSSPIPNLILPDTTIKTETVVPDEKSITQDLRNIDEEQAAQQQGRTFTDGSPLGLNSSRSNPFEEITTDSAHTDEAAISQKSLNNTMTTYINGTNTLNTKKDNSEIATAAVDAEGATSFNNSSADSSEVSSVVHMISIPHGKHSIDQEEGKVGDIDQTTPSTHSSPTYIKVYVTATPTEEPPLTIYYAEPGLSNISDPAIVVSIVDEGSVSAQSVGIAVYLLAVFGLVPLVLAIVFGAKFYMSRVARKSDCESDTSSMDARPPSPRRRGAELRKSPSTATTITLVHATRLPRVQQKGPTWELPRHQLTLLSILGHGNFGQVWKAELQDSLVNSPRLVAVKTVKEGATEREQEEIIKELHIMQHAGHHPNVVTLIGCCIEKDPYYLVMEYVSSGKLLTYLREHRTQENYFNFSDDSSALTSRDLTVFMYCVARGMEYLASKRIIHRDLAARNVLVDQQKMCKIADFGMSRLVQEGGGGEVYEERQHRGALPIRWMSPESLHYSVFTHKSDVWSFGILMWEILTLGSTPYPSLGAREVVQGVRSGLRLQRPPHVKPELFRLVSRCWAQDPQSRPNFTELRLLLADLLDGSCVDLDSYALDNRFQLQTRTKIRKSRSTAGKGTVTLVGNGSFTVNSRILDNQFSIV